jgi:radical SAM protein with 4Fe4S-binding SPASM domain
MTVEISFLWLELTGQCQLSCTHCYASSGPQGTHGVMTVDDWRRVINQAAGLGVSMVQMIGGEPTLHPAFTALVRHALDRGLRVEVFSNLAHVTAPLWEVFQHPHVSLATSYYSDRAGQHDAITQGRGSHARTRAAIAEAVRRSVPIRVGLIDLDDGQRVQEAHAELVSLGVTNIGTDRLRQVGRGVRTQVPDVSQLCGACAQGKVAVSPNGDVWPCVFARWMPIGNVLDSALAEIVASPQMETVQRALGRNDSALSGCPPQNCEPGCQPSCGPSCTPSDFRMAKPPAKCAPQTQCPPASNPSPCNPNCPPGYHTTPKRCWPYYYEHGK